jgi:hypothetical protein
MEIPYLSPKGKLKCPQSHLDSELDGKDDKRADARVRPGLGNRHGVSTPYGQ